MKDIMVVLKIIIGLAILSCLLFLASKIVGALLAGAFWLFIKVPVGVILMAVGLVLCVTIIGIPLGRKIFKAGAKLFVPG